MLTIHSRSQKRGSMRVMGVAEKIMTAALVVWPEFRRNGQFLDAGSGAPTDGNGNSKLLDDTRSEVGR